MIRRKNSTIMGSITTVKPPTANKKNLIQFSGGAFSGGNFKILKIAEPWGFLKDTGQPKPYFTSVEPR